MCLCGFLMCLWAWCAQSACLQRFSDNRKDTPLKFWSICLAYFITLCYCWLGVPNQRACGAWATSEKHAPGILEHVPCIFYRFLLLQLGVPGQRACGASAHDPGILEHVLAYSLPICVTLSSVCPISVPAALWRPEKKHSPRLFQHVPCILP
jgi:hypothetical protein